MPQLTIWKYLLPRFACSTTIPMPKACWVLPGILILDGKPLMYVMVNPERPLVDKKITIYATGEPLRGGHDLMNYRGTWQERGLVWHLFID